MTDTQVTWLTQEAHDRLKAELDQLIANRPVIAAEINDRREEGDLRENGGYHAAREEQGQEEARIRQLQDLLNNAKVGEAPKQSGVALPGSVVKVYYDGDESDEETFLIATRQEGVSDGKLEVYSPNSPLGGALIDAKVGETREYNVPNGNTVKVTLVSAEPYHSNEPGTRLGSPRRSADLRSGRGADRRGPLPPAVGQRCRAARRSTVTVVSGSSPRRCCSIWHYACRIRPAVPGDPVAAGRLLALAGGGPVDPSVQPALELLHRRPLPPRTAVSKLRRGAQDQRVHAPRAPRRDSSSPICPASDPPRLTRGRSPTGGGSGPPARPCCRRCSTAHRPPRRLRPSSRCCTPATDSARCSASTTAAGDGCTPAPARSPPVVG